MTAVRCRAVGVTRGGRGVLADVDLTVGEGEWVALVGPNGAGKTTLLHVLAGLLDATGTVDVGGEDPARASRRAMARAVALMPQRPVVPDGVTVAELVMLGRTPRIPRFGTEGASDRAAVDDVLEQLDLTPFADRHATDLSGGELQRVVLARALAQEPRVLLLDEPTSALDLGHQQQVLELVDHLRGEREVTVLAAMHDLTAAAQYSDRMVLLDQGRVVADGTPAHVLTAERIGAVYGARVEIVRRPGEAPAVLPVRHDRGGS
ncbi:ABC transporter ATP-binding protein [Rhodococcus sp. HNM0569]|uniref:ABC transporter ATP-binding protein n=1 Tax=Rhodococcus sp. HNM0569 TaxID=2716340 RepID=UPI00146E1568|nr:ABC transporter ATP-binding protein [Rhodococcus sp. HNM0569]NLU83181.1 ABC transporter ATP-binding protein [Rhodococcus sp. HNM0569]